MLSNRSLGVLIAALGATGAAACSSTGSPSQEPGPVAQWTCEDANVPNGHAYECTAASSHGIAIQYDCAPDSTSPDCPPTTVNPDAGTPPSTDNSGESETPPATGAGDAGDAATKPGNGNGPPVKTDGNGNGSGHEDAGGGGGGEPPHDCGECNADGCPEPPTGDHPPTTDAGAPGGGGGYHCDDDGSKRTCRKPPQCHPGHHPSPCGACVADGDSDDCSPPANGGCWITGGGFVVDDDGNDSFGGNGMPMKDGRIRGEWTHVDHGTASKAHGQVSYLVCRHVDEPGPGKPGGPQFDINQVYYGGPARWFTGGAWADGYWFDVKAEDHGEPGNKPGPGNHGSKGPDYYSFTLRKIDGQNQSGAIVYQVEGDFEGGNFQVHPPNAGHPFTSSTLPAWVTPTK